MQEEWYVAIDESPNGPHTREVLLQMRRSGRIDAHSLVWSEGMADWASFARAGLDEHKTPPPLPPTGLPKGRDLPSSDHAQGHLPSDSFPLSTVPRDVSREISVWAFERHLRSGSDNKNVAFSHLPPLEVEDDGWQWAKPAPWRRYLARTLDSLMMGLFLWAAVAVVSATMGSDLFQTLFAGHGLMAVPVLSSVVVIASLIPIQALLIGMSGTTVGKWIFGIRVTHRDGRAIGIPAALIRELQVFAFGMGCGVAILSLIASIVAYRILDETGSTNWDKGKDWIVTQRQPGALQTIMFIVGLFVLLLLISVVERLSGVGR